MKIFHIDCGRKYFSVDELKNLIHLLGKNGYNMIELAFGNGGMRFFLKNMEITTSTRTYESDAVKAAINYGNRAFCDCGTNELTEREMEELISLANEYNIRILPLLNSPGHMDAIVMGMEKLGISAPGFKGSVSTIDFDSTEAVEFTKAILSKYIDWFADRGSTLFNMGCDEYANDVLASGFAVLCDRKNFMYDKFISYANSVADLILEAGMKPVMFNDGMYYDENVEGGLLNREIICSYWSMGWPGYTPASAKFVEKQGHAILNTSNEWYYVLGRRYDTKPNPMFNDRDAERGILTCQKSVVLGGTDTSPMGEMFCLWCDEPQMPFNDEEKIILEKLISAF